MVAVVLSHLWDSSKGQLRDVVFARVMKGHSSEPWLCPRPNVPGWCRASYAPITGKTRPHSSKGLRKSPTTL